ncbi:MAG: GntR family transcriptional regulator [Paracoccus sp. (in: a-proteobacteria)]|jgi:DNA-binding GntR family transcriptional regulator|uniref:GntR family transcriptional regulator n=2 Tax=Paracoccus TaxID=265 RepID=UPI000C69F61C|nr:MULTISPECIES: GntR family transcriptional regulator [unclassified Paracoccus (in: a-proteobacteria)]MAN55170.1 GntR family transcriptional regulator [Paracoccus sp. (in: a-proteobacteria)]MBA47954.1 GntR family transcriptional regulator [Paracoccus sp. (in: a-proteobacteria)]MCS5603921.1 GntR family transcriptional regulator [Paracoccus sp. (in: a-proteobacteria)]|tara:strand:+ start:1432 stop:2085 length:654 start_codon:yes stop_codon:yes gene_type:complete
MASAADDISERLEAEIVEGVLPPGTRLEEPALAERFGVSRTPVREALQRLSASGLVELKPRRGTQVLNPSIGRIVEMFEVMAELEAVCARLCARRGDPDLFADLRGWLARCAAAADTGDASAYYTANKGFHSAIYRGSGNLFLSQQAELLHLRLTPFRRQQLRLPRRLRQSLAEHGRIVAAIEAGDAAAAEAAQRAHILIQGERFADLLAQHGSGRE